MPSFCQHCNRRVARFQLSSHENDECEERPTACEYSRIGCPWRGPFHEKGERRSAVCRLCLRFRTEIKLSSLHRRTAVNHEKECSHPSKSGREVLEAVELIEKQRIEERRLLDSIMNLLSFEKFSFTDLQVSAGQCDLVLDLLAPILILSV